MTAIDSGTILSGDVADYGFGLLLDRFASGQSTGSLAISGPAGGAVEFSGGQITFASSPNSLDRRCIAESIVDLDDDDWNEVCSTTDPLGELIERGSLDVVMVTLVVEEVILDALLDLELAGSSPFDFRPSTPSPTAVAFDASALLEQLDERVELWLEAVATLASTTDVIRIAPTAAIGSREVSIEAADWALLAAIDRPTTLAGVISRAGQSNYRSVRGLHRLLSMGAVVRVDDAP